MCVGRVDVSRVAVGPILAPLRPLVHSAPSAVRDRRHRPEPAVRPDLSAADESALSATAAHLSPLPPHTHTHTPRAGSLETGLGL